MNWVIVLVKAKCQAVKTHAASQSKTKSNSGMKSLTVLWPPLGLGNILHLDLTELSVEEPLVEKYHAATKDKPYSVTSISGRALGFTARHTRCRTENEIPGFLLNTVH